MTPPKCFLLFVNPPFGQTKLPCAKLLQLLEVLKLVLMRKMLFGIDDEDVISEDLNWLSSITPCCCLEPSLLDDVPPSSVYLQFMFA